MSGHSVEMIVVEMIIYVTEKGFYYSTVTVGMDAAELLEGCTEVFRVQTHGDEGEVRQRLRDAAKKEARKRGIDRVKNLDD